MLYHCEGGQGCAEGVCLDGAGHKGGSLVDEELKALGAHQLDHDCLFRHNRKDCGPSAFEGSEQARGNVAWRVAVAVVPERAQLDVR